MSGNMILPPWLTAIRASIQGSVSEQDIQEIVQKQVELAKGGDRGAAKFVMDLMTGGQQKIHLTQNNYHVTTQTRAPAFSEKVAALLQAHGEMSTRELAAKLEMKPGELLQVATEAWFQELFEVRAEGRGTMAWFNLKEVA